MLLRDTFSEITVPQLEADGWVITNFTRYDPTHVEGVTPNGRAFTADLIGDQVTITIVGRTATRTIPKATWESGEGTRSALVSVRGDLPSRFQ